LLVVVGRAVLENLDSHVLLFPHYFVEFCAKPVDLGQTQRPEVLVIPIVNQNFINVEEEGVRDILGRMSIAIPIQLVWDDLDGLAED